MAIPEGQRKNFDTLMRACKDGNVALMECTNAETGNPVFVICASNTIWDEEKNEPSYEFIPVAKMFDGNPYEEVDPPEDKSEGDKYVCDEDKEKEKEEAPGNAGTEQIREGGGNSVG